MSRGKLIVFSAPSGSGKSTIIQSVLREFPQLVFSVSATTRKPRGSEKHGVDYFYLSEEDFRRKIGNDEFVEWEKFYDYYYGTLKSFIDDNLSNGKFVVLEIDVKGALQIKRKYSDAELIFVVPPSIGVLEHRLKLRNTENKEDLEKRLARSEMELNYKDKFDHVIVNDKLDDAKKYANEIIKKIIN